MSTQPNWQLVANLGDADPIEHGGAFVLIDTTGEHAAMLEIWEAIPVEGSDNNEFVVNCSRVVLEPHTHVNGVLSDNPYHPDHPAWYADKSVDVASYVDREIDDLVSALCGRATLRPDGQDARDVAIARAQAYRDLISYFGVYEFDQYPITRTTDECEKILNDWGEPTSK